MTSPKNQERDVFNCPRIFEFTCPQIWDELGVTADRAVRYCDQCLKNVFYCETPEEFVRIGKAGECVAVPPGAIPDFGKTNEPGLVPMGSPTRERLDQMIEELDQVKQGLESTSDWWETVFNLTPELPHDPLTAMQGFVQR